jgi:hypothetical protein
MDKPLNCLCELLHLKRPGGHEFQSIDFTKVLA